MKLAPDPMDRWRLVRVGTEFLSQFGTRTEDGYRLHAVWGDPDQLGVYEPTFTVDYTDQLVSKENAVPLTLASLRGETEPEPPDGREAGPRWALWNYETKEWDVLPDGYDPTTDETDENEEEEPA